MKNKNTSLKHRAAWSLLGLGMSAACIVTTGCGMNTTAALNAPVVTPGVALKGSVHGGQQPVSGSSIQLYVASTAGYAAPASALLTVPVSTDGGGGFNITGDYTCPSSASQVYIVASGGNSGGGVNANLAMMTALGSCGNLASTSFISINEVTTVATAYALSPFMTSVANVGTSATNTAGLANAFATVNRLANTGSGTSAGTLPAGAVAPATEINTLADILAACINTTGTAAGGTTPCSMLFSYTTPSGSAAPTDTIGAILNIAKNPGANVKSLLSLTGPSSPFQPVLSAASDFSVSIKYKPTLSKPSASAIDPSGNVWITNSTNNTVSVITANGTPVAFSPLSGSGLNAPSAIAFDAAGDAFVTNKGGNTLSAFTPAGVGSQTAATGLVAPSSVAIDGQGLIWITNSGANSVVSVVATGTTVQSSTTFSGAGVTTPVSVAINPF